MTTRDYFPIMRAIGIKELKARLSDYLRAVLETGLTPDIERRLREARVLVTSRLSRVEAARALVRLRHLAQVSEERLAGARREIDSLELLTSDPRLCDAAGAV